jgi:hypothetical protein
LADLLLVLVWLPVSFAGLVGGRFLLSERRRRRRGLV